MKSLSNINKAYLKLHLAVLLFGTSAIVGDLITLDSLSLVWWRLLLSCAFLIFGLVLAKKFIFLKGRDLSMAVLIGFLVALHWVFFFASIKSANASVSLICLSTVSFMTALIEPFFFKKPHSTLEIFTGILIIPGMILVVKSLDNSYYLGIIYGLLSALFATFFSILNKQLVNKANSYVLTLFELGSGWILLSLIMIFGMLFLGFKPIFNPIQMDWVYLVFLALVITVWGYTLALQSLKYLTAFASNLTINLEPVYGMALAAWILHEDRELSNNFYLGAGIIIFSVLAYPIINRFIHKTT